MLKDCEKKENFIGSKENGKYENIINLEYPFPSGRPRMSLKQRAKIFLPFAALKGFEEALEKVSEEAKV